MSRIEKFGRRRREPSGFGEREKSEQKSDLPPRSQKHPSLRPRMFRLLMQTLVFLFILLSGCLFFWGRSLFLEAGEPPSAAVWKGIGDSP
ncbi:hypothetical protein SAMN05444162_0208 [Paenibacillaceae bacterium GAS479]|nr:hypothetical protein SAMN05444162_0208 [Paenibacillaceae bacterium GAS479]